MAGAQLASIVSQARTLGQFVAPAHQRLDALARNMWWSWDHDTASLFRALDPALWRALDHNPIALLGQIPAARLEERASALVLHSRINYAYRRMQEHLTSTRTWGARNAGVLWARPVAYFSAEFGLHESVPIYSGGLGILAGDHIKAASDLGIPLVGIGLYYDQGYFTQRFDLQRLPAGGLSRRRQLAAAARAGDETRPGQTVTVRIDTRTGTIARASGSWPSDETRCCCSIRTSKAISPKIAASHRACTAATIASASGRSCCSASAASRR